MKKQAWMIWLFWLWISSLLSPAGEGEQPPKCWDIKLRLNTKGQYFIKADTREFQGDFSYEAAWSGSIEEDDSDYLLYHIKAETLRWEIRENDITAGLLTVQTEKDSPGSPVFRMNYVLGDNDRLQFYFDIEGFSVPLRAPGKTVILLLPCAKKETRSFDLSAYDASVVKGTNDIVIPQKDLFHGSSMSRFRWTWKRYNELGHEKQPAYFISSHDAEVIIRIVPRF